jgi:hypothetical protein
MTQIQMIRTLLCSSLFAALLLGCDNPESARIEEVRSKLVGTWLEEAEAGSVRSRRVLTLAADGKFTDRALTISAGSTTNSKEFAGEWSYDGTNFKRRYMQENGRQYAGGSMRFATFALKELKRSELIVYDSIQGRDAIYRRVPDGTLP